MMKFIAIYIILFNISLKKVLSFHLNGPQDIDFNEVNKLLLVNDESEFDIEKDLSEPLTERDFQNGRKLTFEQLHGSDLTDNFHNKLEDKNLFEGDIVIDRNSLLRSRNAIKGNYFKWRNGRIPYTLSNEYNKENRSIIARAIEDYHNKTCVRFVPKRWIDFSYLRIYPGLGCASQVGKMGGVQMVSLGVGCLRFGIIQHELMHVIGFWHEQSRADRDDYIRINWDNVEKGMEGNFVKFSWNEIQSLDEKYDYGSVLHYGTHAFSRGFGSTLSPLKDVPKGVQIGQRIAMSETDVRKVNKLYNCKTNLFIDNFINTLIKLITDLINKV